MSNEMRARRLPQAEEAERQTFHRDVPVWARAKELGIRFGDSQGRLLPKPMTEAGYAARQQRVEAMLATVHQRIASSPAPSGRQHERPRSTWTRQLLALAAAFIAGVSLEPAVAFHTEYEHGKRSKIEQRALGTSIRTVYPFTIAGSFDVDAHSIRGVLHHGALLIGSIGSAGDSAVTATLKDSSDASLDLASNSRGLVISTPTAELQLLLPGHYEISSREKDVGYLRVDSGLAVVRANNGTEHDWTVVHAGEEVRTRTAQLPIRQRVPR